MSPVPNSLALVITILPSLGIFSAGGDQKKLEEGFEIDEAGILPRIENSDFVRDHKAHTVK
jgi:hypothetical protein